MQAERITSIKKIGEVRCVDIEVDSPNHIYYANGIATSNSHAVAYAYVTYASLYYKAHFPQKTYCSWLSFTKEEPETQKEIYDLYNNAKLNSYDIYGPDFRLLNKHFAIHNGNIYFGLIDVFGVGESNVKDLILLTKEIEEKIGSRYSWSYLDLMFRFLYNIGSQTASHLISAGAFDYICSKRVQTKYEYEQIAKLKDTVMPWVLENYHKYNSLVEVLEALLIEFKFRQPRSKEIVEEILEAIKNPPYRLEDSAAWIAGEEKRLLGVSITCSAVDACTNVDAANCTCYDYLQGKIGYLILAASIDEIKEVAIKNGKNAGKKMAFLKISDSSGAADIAVFSECWAANKMYLTKGNTVLLAGKRTNYKDKTWQIEKVWQI